MKKMQKFTLLQLECANCAAKIEKKINEMPGIEKASLTFATKQLKVEASTTEDLLPELQRVAQSIEADVEVKRESEKMQTKKKPSIMEIVIGTILFFIGMLSKNIIPDIIIYIYIVAYVVLGSPILKKAFKNITKGRIFDENFLMSIATLAAFAIGDAPEAVGIMLFYRVGELFEDMAVEKSRNQIMEVIDMRPEVVHVINEDTKITNVVPAGDVKVGDVVLIRPGERIPLDGVIVDGESRLDTSPITGEPIPIKVTKGDTILSGCMNTSGLLEIRVEKILADSMVSRILESVENAASNKPEIERFITKFARIYTPVVVGIALLTAILPSLVTGNWNHWIYTAITFLVISCPCALVLSVPLAFFSGIGAGSKRGILFKGGVTIEALNHIKALVMDKTGTITEGNFVVQDIVTLGMYEEEELLGFAASCEQHSSHPIGNSIVTEAKQRELIINRPTSVEEIAGKGIKAIVDQGEILCGNESLMNSYKIDISAQKEKQYGTEVFLALNKKLIGYILISDTIKRDAKETMDGIKKLGIKTAMFTGDEITSAQAIGAKVGIEEIFAKLLPEDKVQKLLDIRRVYGPVMFVGDGINDAPVLAGADVGAAMGSGADAAIEAADVVFMVTTMDTIMQSLKIAKKTSQIAKQNVVFSLAIKAIVMILGFAGLANMWMAVFADTGVAMICVVNSIRILRKTT